MTRIATTHGSALAKLLASMLVQVQEHGRTHPHETDELVSMLVAHLRSWRPESVAPLGVLGPPTERIVDPRTVRP